MPMKIGTLLAVNAVISTLFGLGFVLAPAQSLLPYGVELPPAGLIITRLFGAALLGYGMITWLLRRTQDAAVLRSLALSLAVADALGTLISLWGVAAGYTNALGWSTVAIYALLCIGFALHAAHKPAVAAA